MRKPLRRLVGALKRLFQRQEPGNPDDPYALVGAPRKPQPPLRSSAIAAEEPER